MKVSVAMATYNGEKFISTQLESILAQTRLPDEIIVSDDSSTDATVLIIKSFAKKSKIKFKILQNRNRLGYAKNFERALRLCTGEYIFMCDQDDKWYPEKIMNMISSPIDALMIHTDARLVDEGGLVIAESYSRMKKKHPNYNTFARILDNNCVTGCTAMIKRDLLDRSPEFPEEIPHDQWLALLAADRNSLYYLPKILMDYRQHENNVLGAGSNLKSSEYISLGSLIKVDRKRHYSKVQLLSGLLECSESVLSSENKQFLRDMIIYQKGMSKRGLGIRSMKIYAKYFKSMNYQYSYKRKLLKLLSIPLRSMFG